MRVLVTGGTGAVGREAVKRLVAHDHDVTVIGRTPDLAIPGASYRQCDIVDFGCLTECVKGMDAIVHLAAIPNPGLDTGEAIFYVNDTGTFNVYRAAANAGIGRIVSASSINALGYNFGTKRFRLQYFPMDEAHPSYTTDPYSFSKQIMEEIGYYFWRREDLERVRRPACMRSPVMRTRSECGKEGRHRSGPTRTCCPILRLSNARWRRRSLTSTIGYERRERSSMGIRTSICASCPTPG